MANRLVLIMAAIGVITLSGCQEKAPAGYPTGGLAPLPSNSRPISGQSSLPSATVTPQEVMSRMISGMSQIGSFSMDADVLNEYQVEEKDILTQTISRWKGSRSVDLVHRQMQMSMVIDNSDPYENYGRFTINMVVTGGREFEQAWTPGGGNTGGAWNKSNLSDETWNRETQLGIVLELLKSADHPALLGSEVINGVDCYVLTVSPSSGAVADWLVSQEQDVGPSLSLSTGAALAGRSVFSQTYHGGIFQLWIAGGTHLLLKAQFGLHFEADSAYLSRLWPTQGISDIASDFYGQFSFSNYDRPVSVEPPPQASETPGLPE